MEPWQYAVLIAAGITGGAINVMAGGGSIITVPVMIFLGVPGPVANGTNRVAILAQNLTAVATFMSRGMANFRLSISLALCALPGALLGAWTGVQLIRTGLQHCPGRNYVGYAVTDLHRWTPAIPGPSPG